MKKVCKIKGKSLITQRERSGKRDCKYPLKISVFQLKSIKLRATVWKKVPAVIWPWGHLNLPHLWFNTQHSVLTNCQKVSTISECDPQLTDCNETKHSRGHIKPVSLITWPAWAPLSPAFCIQMDKRFCVTRNRNTRTSNYASNIV